MRKSGIIGTIFNKGIKGNVMAYIKDEEINEIRSRANIVDIISGYLQVSQKGKNYVSLCPFHNDHSPSLIISPEKQIFNCFTCRTGGNVFSFVMKYENVSFLEAIKIVAQKIGYDLKIKDLSTNIDSKNKIDYEIYDYAMKYYLNNINTIDGTKAREYLQKRGITESIIKEFKLGYSGASKDTFYQLAIKKGWNIDTLDKLGLINKVNENIYDTFINRIVIPIENLKGEVVGFTGRIFNGEDNTAKYLNTKETEIFKKSALLFNYHNAKNFIRERRSVIVVEGNMDAIKLSAKGFKNVVALMGVALSIEQIDILKRLKVPVILMLDNDNAGEDATVKDGENLVNSGIDTRVVRLSGAKDPDEYIVKFGEGRFRLAMDNAISLVEFTVKNLKKDLNLDNTSDKIKFLNEIAKILSKVENTMEREIYIEKIAKGYNISKEAIYAEVNKLIYAGNKTDKVLQSNTKEIKHVEIEIKDDIIDEDLQRRENTIIAILLENNNNIFQKIKEKIKPEDFISKINKKIAKELYNELEKEDCNINKLIDTFDETMQSHITMLMATDFEIEDVDKAVEDILTKYEKERLENRKREILKQLEIEQDAQKKTQLGKELSNVIIALSKIR